MNIHLTLPGSIRSKKNSKQIVSSKGRTYILPSSAYVKWQKTARRSICHQLVGSVPVWAWEKPIHVQAIIYYKGRRPDLSGALESIGDCLESIIWANDAQIESWDGSRCIHDKLNPRTEVLITPWSWTA